MSIASPGHCKKQFNREAFTWKKERKREVRSDCERVRGWREGRRRVAVSLCVFRSAGGTEGGESEKGVWNNDFFFFYVGVDEGENMERMVIVGETFI